MDKGGTVLVCSLLKKLRGLSKERVEKDCVNTARDRAYVNCTSTGGRKQ